MNNFGNFLLVRLFLLPGSNLIKKYQEFGDLRIDFLGFL